MEVRLLLYKFVRRYLSPGEAEYVLEANRLPFLGVSEYFVIEDGRVKGKKKVVRPVWW